MNRMVVGGQELNVWPITLESTKLRGLVHNCNRDATFLLSTFLVATCQSVGDFLP